MEKLISSFIKFVEVLDNYKKVSYKDYWFFRNNLVKKWKVGEKVGMARKPRREDIKYEG